MRITRTRGPAVDTIELSERANDLDREGGNAFIVDTLDRATAAAAMAAPRPNASAARELGPARVSVEER